MIFISHNYKDKPLVEQIAIRLKEIFGQDEVFYDSWSIQPGDGIIEEMNNGLERCKLFLFFVSKHSLQSNMVRLEWQNTVLKASQGRVKIIPVKLDDCMMPPILAQTLYIDLFGQGLEIALRQILDVTSGKYTFRRGPQELSNMRAYTYEQDGRTIVECHAEFFMEPISSFMFLTHNHENEIGSKFFGGSISYIGFKNGITTNDGARYNAIAVSSDKSTIPGFPFLMELSQRDKAIISLEAVMHEKKRREFHMIPLVKGRKSRWSNQWTAKIHAANSGAGVPFSHRSICAHCAVDVRLTLLLDHSFSLPCWSLLADSNRSKVIRNA